MIVSKSYNRILTFYIIVFRNIFDIEEPEAYVNKIVKYDYNGKSVFKNKFVRINTYVSCLYSMSISESVTDGVTYLQQCGIWPHLLLPKQEGQDGPKSIT